LVLYGNIVLLEGFYIISLLLGYRLLTNIPTLVVSGLFLTLLAILRLIRMVLVLVSSKFKIPVLSLGYNSYLGGVPKCYKGVLEYYIVVPNY
jgi:hypothetical protein